MIVMTPAHKLDFYCEAFGRAVDRKDWTQEIRLQALSGLAENIMVLKKESSLNGSFERRVAGIAKLVPQTEAYASIRNALTL